ncbi:autotransporter-associated beta strand repeat-containing protein [uncultured Pseudacidovorax sp.]|uniref:autotransporter-associated beta strand repeat-containing protein n=1 Tax=uncultured Pseudacidovorax sp. TaxID=679313 RepID=UPI0025F159D1|nr:autotransporter-associated beta strand repeat-containing protein [uncultured Pseudacidovorax sp.]
MTVTNYGRLWLQSTGTAGNPQQKITLSGSNSGLYLYGSNGSTVQIGDLNGGGKVDFMDGAGGTALTLSIGNNNQSGSFSGSIINSGTNLGPTKLSIQKDGTGTQTLSGTSNSYSGSTKVNAGVLSLGATNVLPIAGAVTVAGGKLSLGTNFSQTLSGGLTVSGLGTVELNGGTLTLTGGTNNVSSFSGSGTVVVGSGTTLKLTAGITAAGVNIILQGGTLDLGAFTHSLGTLTQTAASTIDFSSAGQLTVANIGSTFTGSLTAAGWTSSNGHFFATAVNGSPARNTMGLAPLNQIKLGSSGDATRTYWATGSPGELLTGAAASSYTYWDTRADLAGINGGDGTWDGTLLNWTTSTGAPNGTWFAGGVATFQGTAGTVTVKDGYSASIGGLTFGTAGYTIAPNGTSGTGKLALASNATLTLPGSGTTTINAPITGGYGVTMAGSGTVTLGGSNTFTGGLTVPNGVTVISTNVLMDVNSPLTVDAGGAVTINSLTGFNSTSVAWSTPWSIAGTLSYRAVTGSALSTWAAYITKVNFNNATVNVDGAGAAPAAGSGNYGNRLVLKGTVSGTGKAYVTNYGTLWLENNTTGNKLAVDVDSNSRLSFYGSGNMYMGSLSGSGSVGVGDTGAGTPNVSFGNDDATTTFSGVLTNAAWLSNNTSNWGLTKAGAGTFTLTGSNTYTGATVISAGTLQIGGAGTLGWNGTNGAYAGAITNNASFKYSSTTNQTLSGAITGSGSLTKDTGSSSTLTLSSTGNLYSGGTTVSAGTLALGVNGALPAAGAVSVSGGVLDLGTFSQTLNGVLTVNGGTLKLGTGSNLTLTSGSGNVTSSIGAIDSSSTGTITVGTGATLNLTAAISASNLKIVMAGGTLNLGSNLSHTIGSLTQNTASSTITFGTSSNLTVGTLGDLGSNLTLTASGWTAGSTHFYANAVASGAAKNQLGLAPLNQVQLGSNAATATYWSSTGNELLAMTTGTYTYWDTNATNTTVDGGSGNWDGSTLNWTPVGGTPRGTWAGGTETAYFNGSAGTVTIANNYAANIGGLNFGTYGYTINANAGGLLMLTKDATITINSSRGQAVAINAPIQGNFGITVTGGGTLQLSSPNNSYTGGTTLSNAGIDLVGPAIACSSSSTSTPLGIGTLSIGSNSGIWLGTDNQLGCPASAGTGVTGVVIQSGGGVNTTAAASTEMPALTLNGGSLMSLNSVSGTGITNGVYRMSGDVQVTADSAISAPNVNNVKAGGTTYNVLSGTRLTIGSTGYFGYGTGPGQADTGFILTGGGTMVFSGASNTATGPIQVTNGTLQVGDSGSTGDIASHASVSLGTSGTLSFKRSNAYTFATAIGGSGKLSQDGGGTTTLSGANTYTGTTSVNSGTLLVTGSTASTSAVTVAAGATLGGSGTVAGTVNVLGFLSPGLGAGTVGTLNTGALTLGNTGTLTLDLGTPGTTGGTANDYVNVTGNVNLGGNLVINKLTGFSTTGSYTLLSYSGTRSGAFASTNLSTIGYQGVIQYDDANKKVLLVAMPRVRIAQVSNGGTGTFSFVMTGLDTVSVSLSTQAAGTAVTSATFNGTVGTAVKIDQTIPNGWPATPGSISCVDANGASTGNGSGALGTVSGVEVNLPGTKLVAGADITCTFTNTRNGIAGVVFNDGGAPSSGANTGTPNDGVQNGAEAGVGGLTVNLTNCAGTTYASTTTDGNGAYGLSIPTAQIGQAVCVQPVLAANTLATGANSAGTVLPNGSATTVGGVGYTYTRASQQASFTAPASGTVTLNFGQVPASTLSPTTSARQAQPGVKAVHTHSFTAGTGGSLQVQLGAGTANPGTVTGWSEIAYLDPGCTGSVQQNATRLYPSGTPMTVVQGQVVCFVVQEQVPVQAGTGNSNAVPVTTALTFTNAAPSLSASYTATDTTTVSNSALQLTKEVRNVTQGVTTFGTNNQAKSGEVLEYRITYTNTAPSPLTSLVINDATPTYTSFVSAKTDTTPSGLTACTKVTPANVAPAPVVGCDVAQTAGGTGPLSWSFTGTLNGGGTGAVLFQVKVD